MLRRLAQAIGLHRPDPNVPSVTSTAPAPAPAPATPPPAPATAAPDRARLAPRSAAPPGLEDLYAAGFEARVARVRAGEAGFGAEERTAVLSTLSRLDGGQRKALRDALALRPPHPAIGPARRADPALVGPPSVEALMRLLSGALFDARPPMSEAYAARVEQVMALFDGHPHLRPALETNDGALLLAERFGPVVGGLLDALGPDGVATLALDFFGARSVAELVHAAPARLPEVKAYLQKRGPAQLVNALGALDRLQSDGHVSPVRAIGALGFAAAVRLGDKVGANPRGARAWRALNPDADLLELPPKQVEGALAEASDRIIAFGSGGVPIRKAERAWPPLEIPRSPRIAAAEDRLVAALGLPADALKDPSQLNLADVSRLARAMKDSLRAADPDAADRLERETAGRRFVSRRYYDALYAAGAGNPGERYSVRTLRSWKEAEAFVREAVGADRGRPLTAGRVQEVLGGIHARAAEGIVEAHESHLTAGDLGRVRDQPEDHVQLGGLTHRVGVEDARKLAANPYLQASAPIVRDGDEIVRTIVFPKGPDVPAMLEDAAAWIAENEDRLPPEALAAEAHFRIVSIHPFMDGNGRTAKLLADYLLARQDVEPPIWRQGDVLVHRDTWPDAVAEGVRFHFETVQRHFRHHVDPEARA